MNVLDEQTKSQLNVISEMNGILYQLEDVTGYAEAGR